MNAHKATMDHPANAEALAELDPEDREATAVELADKARRRIESGPVEPARAMLAHADLSTAAKECALVVERRNRVPILDHVRLLSSGTQLYMTATDMDMELSVAIPVAADSRLAFTVPAHLLRDYCREAPGDCEVSMTAPAGDDPAKLRFGSRMSYTLQSLPADDFPNFAPGHDWRAGASFAMAGADMREMLQSVQFAVSTEETRYYLNGVYLHCVDESGRGAQLVAVATDGHRLARIRMDAPDGAANGMAGILPRKAVAVLLKLWAGKSCPESVRVALTKSCIKFVWPGRVLVSKLVDGTYPEYQRVIPTGNPNRLTFDSVAMTRAIKAVTKIASERGRPVKLILDSGRATLVTSNPDAGRAETEIQVEYDAEPLEIGFNARYLLEVLANVAPGKKGQTVTMEMSDSGSPALIHGENRALTCVLATANA